MKVSKQKMPEGKAASDTPSMYAVRDAITAPRKQIEVPVLSTFSMFSMELRFAPVTMARAPWEKENG